MWLWLNSAWWLLTFPWSCSITWCYFLCLCLQCTYTHIHTHTLDAAYVLIHKKGATHKLRNSFIQLGEFTVMLLFISFYVCHEFKKVLKHTRQHVLTKNMESSLWIVKPSSQVHIYLPAHKDVENWNDYKLTNWQILKPTNPTNKKGCLCLVLNCGLSKDVCFWKLLRKPFWKTDFWSGNLRNLVFAYTYSQSLYRCSTGQHRGF